MTPKYRTIVFAILVLTYRLLATDEADREDDIVVKPSVVGGRDAEQAYPWMVSFLTDDTSKTNRNRHYCAGVLIHPEWVLTAAHCVEGSMAEELKMVIGSSDLNEATRHLRARTILVNPGYFNIPSKGADIALVRLAEPLTDIEPVVLVRDPENARNASSARIIGWGRTSYAEDFGRPEVLQEADVSIFTLKYVNQLNIFRGDLSEDYIPAGEPELGRDAYYGDSGGPLLIQDSDGNWEVAGITSFGIGSCSEIYGYISLFTDVSIFDKWIRGTVFESPLDMLITRTNKLENNYFLGYHPLTNERMMYVNVWPFSKQKESRIFDEYSSSESRFNFGGELSHREIMSHLFHFDQLWYYGRGLGNLGGGGRRSAFLKFSEEVGDDLRQNSFHYLSPRSGYRYSSRYSDPESVEAQDHFVFFENLRVGQEYALMSDFSNPVVYSWVTVGSSIVEVEETTFTAREGRSYIVNLGVDGWSDYYAYLIEGKSEPINASETIASELTEEDPINRLTGFHYKEFDFDQYFGEEVKITVESIFDAEIEIYDDLQFRTLGFYDDEGANEKEEYIVAGSILSHTQIRISNFSANQLGSFTLRVEPYQDSDTVNVPSETKRAITRYDESFTASTGVEFGAEVLDLENVPNGGSVTIRVDSLEGESPALAVYSIEDEAKLVDTAYEGQCQGYAELTFVPEAETKYVLWAVAPIGDGQSTNYLLRLTVGDAVDSSAQDSVRNDFRGDTFFSSPKNEMDQVEWDTILVESYLTRNQSPVWD